MNESEEKKDEYGVRLPAAELAWLMFTQSGMPGMYMLYSGLVPPLGALDSREERSIFD